MSRAYRYVNTNDLVERRTTGQSSRTPHPSNLTIAQRPPRSNPRPPGRVRPPRHPRTQLLLPARRLPLVLLPEALHRLECRAPLFHPRRSPRCRNERLLPTGRLRRCVQAPGPAARVPGRPDGVGDDAGAEQRDAERVPGGVERADGGGGQ